MDKEEGEVRCGEWKWSIEAWRKCFFPVVSRTGQVDDARWAEMRREMTWCKFEWVRWRTRASSESESQTTRKPRFDQLLEESLQRMSRQRISFSFFGLESAVNNIKGWINLKWVERFFLLHQKSRPEQIAFALLMKSIQISLWNCCIELWIHGIYWDKVVICFSWWKRLENKFQARLRNLS